MSDVRFFRIKHRITSLALGRGGLMAREAIKQAEKAIEAKDPELIATIDANLGELETRYGASSADGSVGDYEGLYGLAANIIELSTCLRGSLIDKAAYALCSLADISAESEVWDRQAVEIHILALRLLRYGGESMDQAQRQRLVDGLSKVTAKRVGGKKKVEPANEP